MALYEIDVRHRVAQRVTARSNAPDNKRVFLIQAGSAKKAWAKASRAMQGVSGADCTACRHTHCKGCDECSLTKQYSDYWICHCCGELNARVQDLQKEVSYGLGKD